MKFNRYILVSVLSHILCFSIFLLIHTENNTEASVTVFDVNIVDPVIEKPIVPDSALIPAVPVVPFDGKPEDSDIPPETMDDAGDPPAGDLTEELQSNNSITPGSGESEESTSADEEGILPEDRDGIFLAPKEFLFDKVTIDKYARKGIEKKKGLSFDVPEFHYRGYKRRLKSRIESVWKYPPGVIVPGTFVDLNITFSIKRDGSLGDIKLVRTSGHEALDRAALKALRDAAPYWPLPDDWEGDEIVIPGHFIYLLGRSIIM